MNTNDSKSENGEVTFPFVMNQMPDFVVKQAERELNETAENKTRGLPALREMIKETKTISDIDFHDDFLRQFLRRNKYDVTKAFNQLQNNISSRKKRPHFFEALAKKDFAKISSAKIATYFPRRSPEGCAIAQINIGNINPRETGIDDIFRYIASMFIQSLRDPMTQVCGYKIIYIFKNASPRYLLQFTPQKAWLYYSTGMYVIPARYKEVHLVDESYVMKTMWFIIKNFLSEKMKRRIYIHSSPEKLLDYFPASVLPEEYGGDLKNYFMPEWNLSANQQTVEGTLGGQANIY